MVPLSSLIALLLPPLALADTLLFNGAQDGIFEDASTECLAAFNTSLACDSSVQLLSYDMDRLEFDQDSLTTLCTASCSSSLRELETAVASACRTYDVEFNGAYLTAVQVVDLFFYKYNMSCLADGSGSFCLMVEDTWDVDALDASGQATWPTFTNKTYPNFQDNDDGSPSEDEDGNLVDLSEELQAFTDYGLELDPSGQNYYQEGISVNYTGHGWPTALEYDEYPLEIQCSECFLAQYKLGIESQWGEPFDEVSDQVWSNLRQNCDLDWELSPANNLSTWAISSGPLRWTYSATCGQTITYTGSSDSLSTTANALALANNVPTAALMGLNAISWNIVPAGSYCAPESCQVAVVNQTTGVQSFVASYGNITETQFWTWNNYMDSKNLIEGEVVCVGPPGGSYTPVSTAAANPTVYTVTATPAEPTPSGTIPNCGLYYGVLEGQTCDTITLNFSLTLDQFLAMNPEVYSNCSNLLYGFDYCVATVSGGATVTSSATTVTSTIVPAPTQTVTGTTSQCYEWYVIQSGETCADIEEDYDITLDTIRALNTYIDAACDNIWANYAYCVNGVAASSTSTATVTASTTTSTIVAAPTQTVAGTTDECYEWYVVQSGETCADMEEDYGITLDTIRALNTYVDAACDNIWANYAYCVNGVAEG